MELKEKAINRMKQLKLMPNVINDFKKKDRLYYSEKQNKVFDGILYWLDNEPDYVKAVKDFEAEHNALVYHCQLSHTTIGDMLTLLFVREKDDPDQLFNHDLMNKETYAYVINLTDPDLSEFGYVGIVSKNGGVSRTY